MLKALFTRAIDLGWCKDDPTLSIKGRKTGSWRSWTDAEIAAMEARWPIGTRERLAFALHLYTGQPRSDVVLMDPGRHRRRGDPDRPGKDGKQGRAPAPP